ncbi:MAG: hypothetical protein JXB10_11230 [Pirellulales bacterium]|nr:hypothetical protein [Pirellulales bacterium]
MYALMLFLTGAAVFAEPAAPPAEELKTEVRRLIRQLDADQLAEREAAERALIEKGPAIYDLLPESDQDLSAEVQQRLARVRLKLQQAVVASAAQPSRITLAATKMPLSKVFEAIEKQSGNQLGDFRGRLQQAGSDPPLTLTFEKTPFWKALDQVLDAAQMTVYAYGNGSGLNIVPRSPAQRPRQDFASYDGPFRFAVTKILAARNFQTRQGAALFVNLEAAWEPRLKPIVLVQKLADVVAEDERGEKLKLLQAKAEQEISLEGESAAAELTLPFALPPRSVQRIARLSGRVTALVPGRVETFRFADLLKAKNQRQRGAGVTAILEEVRENNQVWEVRFRVKFDRPGDALASHRGWIFRNEAFLETPDGKPIPYDSTETTFQTDDEVGMTYIFVLEEPPEKLKFVYKTPGAILGETFEYEFKDIPLP